VHGLARLHRLLLASLAECWFRMVCVGWRGDDGAGAHLHARGASQDPLELPHCGPQDQDALLGPLLRLARTLMHKVIMLVTHRWESIANAERPLLHPLSARQDPLQRGSIAQVVRALQELQEQHRTRTQVGVPGGQRACEVLDCCFTVKV